MVVCAISQTMKKEIQILDVKRSGIMFWKKMGILSFTDRSGGTVNPLTYPKWIGGLLPQL